MAVNEVELPEQIGVTVATDIVGIALTETVTVPVPVHPAPLVPVMVYVVVVVGVAVTLNPVDAFSEPDGAHV